MTYLFSIFNLQILELVNDQDERSIGYMKTCGAGNSDVTLEENSSVSSEIYVPLILWNFEILGYISDPPEVSTYKAYRCLLKTN